ncbi:MAG: hypothetical protein AAF939_20065, partial [Planctomycetota bacterium]
MAEIRDISKHADRRMNPVAGYLMALAVAIGSYSLYLKFAVPVIVGNVDRSAVRRIAVPKLDIYSTHQEKEHLVD